ncbi:hypothetical protein KAR91_53560 [Candidatus Pacearchaeota archaeon]|nr:hypothetical protein [Candidatus Pacearchaeota archaeon]
MIKITDEQKLELIKTITFHNLQADYSGNVFCNTGYQVTPIDIQVKSWANTPKEGGDES